jgi:hypothetical protein
MNLSFATQRLAREFTDERTMQRAYGDRAKRLKGVSIFLPPLPASTMSLPFRRCAGMNWRQSARQFRR